MTLVRKSTELAVATIFTVAVRKFPTFQSPVGHSARPHDRVKRTRPRARRSEEHTSELQSLMRSSYAVFCLKKKTRKTNTATPTDIHNQPHHTQTPQH